MVFPNNIKNLKKKIITEIVDEYVSYVNKDIPTLIKFYKEKQNIKELNNIMSAIEPIKMNFNLSLSNVYKKFNAKNVTRLGDVHANKSCTLQIELENRKLIYKTFHHYFIELINNIYIILNTSGKFKFYQLIYQVFNDQLYIEYIENEAPQNLENFSLHYGGLILLLTILRGTDFHADNILCKSSTPIIVDYETFFYPFISIFKPYNVEATSLIKTKNNTHTIMHRYNLDRDYILEGIDNCFNVLEKNRKLLKELVINYHDKPSRVIFKPTSFYLDLLKNSTHPLLLQNRGKRIKYIHECLKIKKNHTGFIINDEIQDLLELNIPYFYFIKGNLYSSRRKKISQDKLKCPLNFINDAIDNMDIVKKEIVSFL